MVKKKVGGSRRYRGAGGASSDAAVDKGSAAASQGLLPPQHVQRKVNRKVKFLERVAASQKASLAASSRGVTKKHKKKSKPLPTLDSLAGVLDELTAGNAGKSGGSGGSSSTSKAAKHLATKGRGSSVKRLKARQAIALTETQRLQAVIQHPSYKADPLAAIVHHLQATLPPPAKQRAAAGGLGGKQGCKRHGGKQRRQQGGGASMQTD